VTGASDQYSLGVVGYEMITGRPPFTGGSMMTIMYGHFNEAPPPIPPLRPDCPPELQSVIMQMLEKDPVRRWPTVDDAVAAVGAQALSHDDPTRTQLVSLAKEGAAKTQALIGKMSVPLSPIPGTRSRPGVTAPNPASAASAAPTAVTPRSIRPQTVPAPSSGAGKGALIGGGIALVAVVAGLLVMKPWQKPAPAEPAPSGAVTPSQPAATDSAVPVQQGPAQAATNPAAQTQAPAGDAVVGTKEDGSSRIHEQSVAPAPAPAPNIRQPAPNPKDKAAYDEMRTRVDQARQQAMQAGATPAELYGGDILRDNGSTYASRDKYSEAMTSLTQASSEYVGAMNGARQRAATAAAAAAQTPVQQAPAPATASPPVAEPVVDERPAVKVAVFEYAQAMAAGSLARMDKIYPSMPKDIRANYSDIFKSGSQFVTDWEPYSITVSGLNATANLQGTTRMRDKKGKDLGGSSAPKAVKLQKQNGAWVITEVVSQ
ncbi:MAG TPA: hypothetical protein VMJ30_04110, partial [Gemmatimonadales bacterium]|nr:hypothetical protein [Gemmatimonadales bacterium]